MTMSPISNTPSIVQAYKVAQNLPAAGGMDDGAAVNFGQLLQEATQSISQTMQTSDRIMQQGLRGEVGPQQVVEATIALETSVRTIVAVRDKLVEAYQEIMRMPI
jgi:flagellar hook-basal body complex protein FliE